MQKWTNDEIDFLTKWYGKKSKKQIANELNRTSSSVQTKAHKLGLKIPDAYHYDVDFFKNIDNEEKAYWLGFILADGYINERVGVSYMFGIELGIQDIEHLKKFNKSIQGNVPIKTKVKHINDIGDTHLDKDYKFCSITLYRKQFVDNLKQHGIKQHKALNVELPILADNLMLHFIRGYYDGDGSVGINKKQSTLHFIFTSGCKDFLESLREYLYRMYDIKSYIHQNHPTTYQLHIQGRYNSYYFGQLIYKDANIYLDRKYKRYKQYIQEYHIEELIKGSTAVASL